MRYRERMDEISWTDHAKNEVSQRSRKSGIFTCNKKERRVTSRRNCLIKHVIEGKIEERIEVTGRRGRRRKRRLDDIKEMKESWKFKEDALGGSV